MIQIPKPSNSGFTIIEMILVIFIISVAILGVYNAFSLMIILNTDSIDRLQAAYLSQEGIEIIRNIRDTNWLQDPTTINPDSWKIGLADTDTDCSQGCEADYTTQPSQSNFLKPWTGSGDHLNVDSNGFYGYDTVNSKASPFRRKITVIPLANQALKVISETYWNQKPSVLDPTGSTQEVKVEEILYNWY